MLITTNDTAFELKNDETLLEGLIRTGHKIEYQCKKGYCGLCRVKLLNGNVNYIDYPLACIREDEILPCCCKLLTPIKIDVFINKTPAKNQEKLFDK